MTNMAPFHMLLATAKPPRISINVSPASAKSAWSVRTLASGGRAPAAMMAMPMRAPLPTVIIESASITLSQTAITSAKHVRAPTIGGRAPAVMMASICASRVTVSVQRAILPRLLMTFLAHRRHTSVDRQGMHERKKGARGDDGYLTRVTTESEDRYRICHGLAQRRHTSVDREGVHERWKPTRSNDGPNTR